MTLERIYPIWLSVFFLLNIVVVLSYGYVHL